MKYFWKPIFEWFVCILSKVKRLSVYKKIVHIFLTQFDLGQRLVVRRQLIGTVFFFDRGNEPCNDGNTMRNNEDDFFAAHVHYRDE